MMKLRRVAPLVTAALLAGVTAGCDTPPSPWTAELVSVNATGDDSSTDGATGAQFSPDGRAVAFLSSSGNFGPPDTDGGSQDVYLRDLAGGETTLITPDADGSSTRPGWVSSFGFSPDGTRIAFTSPAGVFGPADTNDLPDVYVRDLATGEVTLVSSNAAGTDAGDGWSDGPVFSPDGSKVLFRSQAGDLGPTDTNRAADLYLRDLATGEITLVTANAAGTDAANGATDGVYDGFSADGTKVGFTSIADDLLPTGAGAPVDGNGTWDAYVRDLTTGETSLVSVDATGTAAGSQASTVGPFSPDGTKVAFASDAGDLGPTDTNRTGDVYLRDLATGETSLVSVNAAGTDAGNDTSWPSGLHFSPDGTELLFDSDATDLGPPDTNSWRDIYLRDLTDGSIVQVTANAGGTDAGNALTISSGSFSPDGARVVFVTFSDDLGPRDTNGSATRFAGWDVYVRNLRSGTATLVSAIADGTDSGNGNSGGPSFGPDGTQVAFSSGASNLGPRDTNGTSDIYVATLHGADLVARLTASPTPARPGRSLTYTIEAANEGPDDAEDTYAALLIPEGTVLLEATSATAGGGADGGGECEPPPPDEPRLVVCPVGDVEAGDSTEIEVTVRVTAPPGTTLRAVAAYDRSATPDPDRRNDVAVLDTPVSARHPA